MLALKNREDDLAQVAFDLFYQTLYETHPYRLLTLGSQASVSAMTQAHIAAYYTTLLDPERLVLSVVGDVETTQMIDRLSAGLSSLPAVTPPSAPAPEARPSGCGPPPKRRRNSKPTWSWAFKASPLTIPTGTR